MKKLLITGSFALAFGLAIGGLSACSSDDPETGNDGGVTGTDGSTTGWQCDPASGTPQGQLLNAPLDNGVEVIMKTPSHPGDPGPDNLP